VAARARVSYAFAWTVPTPENWHDLDWLQLRIRHGGKTILWLKFDEGTKTFSISKHANGKFGRAFAAGTDKQLKTSAATLYLADTTVVASGPTSPTVTLNLSLSFKGKAAGHDFIVEVAAKNDQGIQSGFEQAGTLSITREHESKRGELSAKPKAGASSGRLPGHSIKKHAEQILS
jgi:hypothetical protein